LQVLVANRVRQIADVKFVAHEGTPLKHNNKSDGVPKAQQIFKRTAVARETDRSPNLWGKNLPRHIMSQTAHKYARVIFTNSAKIRASTVLRAGFGLGLAAPPGNSSAACEGDF
jgi:hypothetical protein